MNKPTLRRRRPKPLPENLGMLSERQARKAHEQRVTHIRRLDAEGRSVRGERKQAILAELRETADDVKRLNATLAVAGMSPSDQARATQVGARARAVSEPRKRTPADRALSVLRDQWSMPNELAGTALHPGNLSDEEGKELYALLELRHLPDAPGWNEEQRLRFEALVEKAAGWPCFAELEAERDIQRMAEDARRDGLPKRREFAEIGSVRLPASVFDDLRGSKGRGLTPGDIGALVVLLNAFDLRDASVFKRAQFEDDVLVYKGELRFASGINPPIDAVGSAAVHPDMEYLCRLGWFEVAREGGRMEIRLGPRALALREGKS